MVETPILTVHFNRPKCTRALLKSLARVRPKVLYVGIDGSRANRPAEAELVNQVKKQFERLDWDCKIETNYFETNQGCKRAVQQHLKWFLAKEPFGLILEDDCIAHPSFFKFSARLLQDYRNDARVMSINGSNLGFSKMASNKYGYTAFMNMWGWATWQRAYENIDTDMKSWIPTQAQEQLNAFFERQGLPKDQKWIDYWAQQFNMTARGEIDTWDYQWIYSSLKNGSVSIVPPTNMVENIGWGVDATHTLDLNPFVAGLKGRDCSEILQPENSKLKVSLDYEEYIKEAWCGLQRYANPNSKLNLLRKKILDPLQRKIIRARHGL